MPLLKNTVPGPENSDHAPVPTVGVLPPRAALVSDPHMFCVVGLTVAVVGVGKKFTVTVADEVGQLPLLMVHLY